MKAIHWLLLPLLVVCVIAGPLPAADDDWSLPDSRFGVRSAPILLLTRRDVQSDLKLDPQQLLSLRRVLPDIHRRAQALKGKPDADVIVARRQIDEEQGRWLESQLSESQQARLLQIDLQWEGPSATVTRSWVASYLELTNEQRQHLAGDVAKLRAAPASAAGLRTNVQSDRLLKGLSQDQKMRWDVLVGKPCEFQADSSW
jgi:hypothetical protein